MPTLPLTPSTARFASELSDMPARVAAVHAQNLETAFVVALTRHIGYCPTPDEARQHARIVPLGDGVYQWQWDGVPLMEERPTAREDGKFNLPEIVIL